MTKYDENLGDTMIRLVPDDVTEVEFWRNFFYHIELWKKNQGFENSLGEQVDQTRREEAVQEELKAAEEEIEKLKQEFPDAVDSGFKVEDESNVTSAADNSEVELQAV